MNIENSYINMYKKMDATSKTRFHASRRLRLHAKFSTYTIVIISLGLILISLMQAYDLGENIHSRYLNLIQVFSAIAVLVYSLIIEKNEYSNLSEKMYSCASLLGSLKQKLYPHLKEDVDQGTYARFHREYNEILKIYETHSVNDFRADYLRAQLEMPEHYEITGIDWILQKARIYFSYILNFSSYIFVLLSLFAVIYWLLFIEATRITAS